jgi:glycosyltransferase involved in cell wall biosynthesis
MIGLGLITLNEEEYVERCIKSAEGLYDELIVLDHFSSDRTAEICADLGAQVVQAKWIHDFSLARNQLNNLFTSPWIFQMDADEHLEGEKLNLLSHAVEISENQGIVAWSLLRKNHYPDHDAGSPFFAAPFYPDPQVRLFKNQPEIYWSGAVHEGVSQAITEGNIGTIGRLSVCLHHHMFRGNQEKYEDLKGQYYSNIQQGVFHEDGHPTNKVN